MIESLSTLFNSLDLSWIDTSSEIVSSNAYSEILTLFPNLKEILQDGLKNDPDEFQRTIRHIFRSFKIFFLLTNGEFSHDSLSEESLRIIQEKILTQHSQNPLILPIILMYHDIGRLYNKKEHPYESFSLIRKHSLLKPFDLSDIDELIIKKLIQYHLLFATIYTGESTFYGVYSLINDSEFEILGKYKGNVNRFLDLLEIFTYIDVLGYSYARIYDHYIGYYDQINSKLKNALILIPDKRSALSKAIEYSQRWLDWRIAGGLRIFQYVNTKPHLNEKFYFQKIKESVDKEVAKISEEENWDKIKELILPESFKIQVKYGLAVLMLLAFGRFFRGPLEEKEKISNNLVIFWILLSKEIYKRTARENKYLWNVYFTGLPNWWNWDRKFKRKLNYHTLTDIIEKGVQYLDKEKMEFNFYLDFESVFNVE
jgi:hypothetical protein